MIYPYEICRDGKMNPTRKYPARPNPNGLGFTRPV